MGNLSSMMSSSMKLWKELLPGDNGNLVNDVIKSSMIWYMEAGPRGKMK